MCGSYTECLFNIFDKVDGMSLIFIYLFKVQVSQSLICQVWLCQVDSSITLSFGVDPEEVLQISLKGQDKFFSLDILYDLFNCLLVGTHEYQVFCVQGVQCLPSVEYSLVHCGRLNPISFVSFPARCWYHTLPYCFCPYMFFFGLSTCFVLSPLVSSSNPSGGFM